MSNELCAFALKTTLNEIKNVCPDLSHSLIFDKDANILATDEDTSQENATQAAYALNALIGKAEVIGGIDSTTFETAEGRVSLICTPTLRIATVASSRSEERFVTALHRVLVPTVLELAEKISQKSSEEISQESLPNNFTVAEETITTEETEQSNESAVQEQPAEETIPIEDELSAEPSYPEPMATQFMIENVGGLLVSTDTVQIDNAAILQWNETYEDKKITEVEIETLSGQTTRCKFKPIKDTKHNGKGVIRIPKKVQLALQACEGELVTVKPVLEL